MAPSTDRAGLLPAVLSIILTLFAVGGSVGFLAFQGREQQRYLAAHSESCRAGTTNACDALRSLCLKRDPDACVALADANLATGPNQDVREAARLLGEACRYRHPAACLRAGRMALQGGASAPDLPLAKKLLQLGCEIGEKEACHLRASVP